MDEGRSMTDETKEYLPGIIEEIDELRDEVEKIHAAEVEECNKKRDEMDQKALIGAAVKVEHLYGAYIALDNAARILAGF
jgi:uncharacterized coiled-coil DUF342 family protein